MEILEVLLIVGVALLLLPYALTALASIPLLIAALFSAVFGGSPFNRKS